VEKYRDKLWVKRLYKQFKINLTKLSPTLASRTMYRISMGKPLNLKEPTDFNEKIMWLKLNSYYNNPLVTKCADKYAVREYINEKGFKEITNNLIDVYNSVEEIDWSKLPNKFVFKCNHGCGYNIICDNKQNASKDAILKTLDEWMHQDYYLENAEVNYKFIKKKIICEDFIETDDGHLPNDYKIYCFDGEPKLVLACFERDVKLKLVFLDINWQPINVGKDNANLCNIPPKPKSFESMLKYSQKLSEGFPFVRMDFYDVKGRVVFGEMTFTPAGGLAPYYSEEGLQYLGNLLRLPIGK
jgi:hypothetical protein